MGAGGKTPKVVKPTPLPQVLPPVDASDPRVSKVRDNRKRRAAARSGRTSTIYSSPQGLSDEPLGTKKTLLGE